MAANEIRNSEKTTSDQEWSFHGPQNFQYCVPTINTTLSNEELLPKFFYAGDAQNELAKEDNISKILSGMTH